MDNVVNSSAWQRLLTKKLPLIHNQYVDMGNPTQMENIYICGLLLSDQSAEVVSTLKKKTAKWGNPQQMILENVGVIYIYIYIHTH